MEFEAVIGDIKKNKLAARCYQQEGHRKFRDRITIGINGKVFFERFNWGEAAGLVFSLWGQAKGGAIVWQAAPTTGYDGSADAPSLLNGVDGDGLLLDGKSIRWLPEQDLKTWPAGGLGRLKMLFG